MIVWDDLKPGSHRLRCPACGRERRNDKTLGVTVDHAGAGVAHCFRCEFVETHRTEDVHDQLRRGRRSPQFSGGQLPARRGQLRITERQPASRVAVELPAQHDTLSPAGRAIWQAALTIEPGSAAAYYLKARRCVLPPEDGHLRWLPAHRHPTGHVGPALVALLTDTQTGEPRSLHFTWLAGGRKADVNPPRLLLRGHRKADTVCRLWPDEFVTHGLGIAEGIETALSLAHGCAPVWAAVDAGNLAALPLLAGVGVLVIGCDRDPAGEKAATACARRWAIAGVEVLVTRQQCNDLNDLLQGVEVTA